MPTVRTPNSVLKPEATRKRNEPLDNRCVTSLPTDQHTSVGDRGGHRLPGQRRAVGVATGRRSIAGTVRGVVSGNLDRRDWFVLGRDCVGKCVRRQTGEPGRQPASAGCGAGMWCDCGVLDGDVTNDIERNTLASAVANRSSHPRVGSDDVLPGRVYIKPAHAAINSSRVAGPTACWSGRGDDLFSQHVGLFGRQLCNRVCVNSDIHRERNCVRDRRIAPGHCRTVGVNTHGGAKWRSRGSGVE